MCKKNCIPIAICFCVIALQRYREILKKYRKRAMAITLEKKQFFKNLRKTFFFKKLWKWFLDNQMRDVIPKFRSCRLNGVATIENIHIQILKKTTEKAISREINIFSKIWKICFLDINERKLFTKFECHSVHDMAIISRNLTKYTHTTKK